MSADEADETASSFPPGVRRLHIGDFNHMGVDERSNQLYWRGHPVVTKHELGTREFYLALAATVATVASTLVAIAAYWAEFGSRWAQ